MQRKKAVSGLIILGIILSIAMLSYSVSAASSSNAGQQGMFKSRNLGEAVYYIKRTAYAFMSLDYSKEDMNFIIANFRELILLNPEAYSREVQDGLKFFLGIIQPMYILSIAVTAFYLIFISGSPGGRSKAKTFMKDLIVGMIIISLSPMLLQGLMNLSAEITNAILDQTDVSIVTRNLESTFGTPAKKGITEIGIDALTGPVIDPALMVLTDDTSTLENLGSYLQSHSCTLCIMHWMVTFTEIELGYYTFLPFLLVIWGMGVYFFLRFAMITLFMIIFPLSVLLYSFETTKAVGRNMLEQTIMWIFLQVFSAVIVVSVALALIQANLSLLTLQGIPEEWGALIVEAFLLPITYPLVAGIPLDPEAIITQLTKVGPFVGIQIGGGISIPNMLATPLIEFIPFVGCFVILVAPLFIMRLFKGFLP
ncbi:MAG: hypothetical protein WAX07_10850 [Candidatus Altiarchaeia archaeon]